MIGGTDARSESIHPALLLPLLLLLPLRLELLFLTKASAAGNAIGVEFGRGGGGIVAMMVGAITATSIAAAAATIATTTTDASSGMSIVIPIILRAK